MSSSNPSSNPPCAACKIQRRKCAPDCVFAPYFPPDEPQKFLNVHKVFGASNVSKILTELDASQREDAANSLAFEAEARIRDPVYGCVGFISVLQQRLKQINKDLINAKSELATYIGHQGILTLFHHHHPQPQASSFQASNQQQVFQGNLPSASFVYPYNVNNPMYGIPIRPLNSRQMGIGESQQQQQQLNQPSLPFQQQAALETQQMVEGMVARDQEYQQLCRSMYDPKFPMVNQMNLHQLLPTHIDPNRFNHMSAAAISPSLAPSLSSPSLAPSLSSPSLGPSLTLGSFDGSPYLIQTQQPQHHHSQHQLHEQLLLQRPQPLAGQQVEQQQPQKQEQDNMSTGGPFG
ncbi:hypothetical protein UlMin_039326 [Ulmus minor]